ncbi:MAG: hypothetical protein DI617_09130 [Streptococcus pyogenes]|nr:MAG: hypothetical protein DI617_09130 [Streptococcus pyogenes]
MCVNVDQGGTLPLATASEQPSAEQIDHWERTGVDMYDVYPSFSDLPVGELDAIYAGLVEGTSYEGLI